MGFFEDGYLEAVVRGAGPDHRQANFYNCEIFEMSCSSQPFLNKPTSSLMAMSEDASSVLVPEISSSDILAKNVKTERTDLHDIFDSGLLQSSTFALDSAPDSPASIYSSSTMSVKKESVEGDHQSVLYGVHVGNHSPLTPQAQLFGEMITAPVSSSEVVSGTTTTRPSPENQTGIIDLAKNSPRSPHPKESASHSLQDTPSSKQPGSKRSRKGQQKRVVCVPIAGTGRSSSEILPSDMWAWRKYGQKPIKGSPYPRGYYRCSSSKGCSARKQVERSRNDPSMLVITYTSEHNHAWPAHRNSLAGTTRTKALDKLRINNTDDGSTAMTAPLSNGAEPDNAVALSMSSCSDVKQKQETYPLPSPLEEYVPSVEILGLMEDPQMMLDNTPIIPISSSQDHHLFQDLESLPELSTIIGENFFYYRSEDETGMNNMVIDPFDIFCWSSSSTTPLLGSKIVG